MGSKSSRYNSESGEALSQEEINELCQDTGFTEEELTTWHTNFYKDCPDGKLTLKQFEHEYSKIMGKPTQKTSDYVKHMFNVYDHDKNQFIDFKEFVMAISAASVVNRLRLVETIFSIFDLDNDGKVTKDEMGKMLHTLVDVTKSNRKHRHHHSNVSDPNKEINLEKRLDDAFNELNTNDDDHITKEEFIEWYMKTGLLSDVQSNEINVPSTSRIQQLDRKSRKIRKQQVSFKKSDTDATNHPQLTRYMSRMTEQKTVPTITVEDEVMEETPVIPIQANSDDSDSHSSKENERWQHLFNSVLGQIRAQRSDDEEELLASPQTSRFDSWKKQGEEKLKQEYFKQKSNEGSASPNVVTIRL